MIEELDGCNIEIYNPRRPDWDWSQEQDISNPVFYEQVWWELDQLERADIVSVYFDPNGKGPISLLELGLFLNPRKTIVCCPEGYWRRGNVEIVCERYNVLFSDNLEEHIENVKERCR